MFGTDLSHALRSLEKRPTFTILAVLTLALGIGATTAIFSVVNGVVLRPLPYEESERLVVPAIVSPKRGYTRGVVAYPEFLEWREQEDIFEHVTAYREVSLDLTGEGEPEKLLGLSVAEDYFQLLRVQPIMGRAFHPEDYVYGNRDVVILSKGLWQRRFGTAADLVGGSIRLSDRPYTVIGVFDEQSVWPRWPEIWTPMAFGPPIPEGLKRWDNMFLRVLARYQPGVEIEQAETRLQSIAQRVARELPAKRAGVSALIYPLDEWIVEPRIRLALYVLLGSVGFVLLVACVNVANLFLARAAERQRETSICLALGAGRRRMLRTWLTEALVLSLLGAAAGVVLAGWGIDILKALGPEDIPRLDRVELDTTVLGFALGLSLLTALAFSVIPWLHIGRARLSDTLKESSRGSAGSGAARKIRAPLVVSEVALSLVLLIGAGLMLRSFSEILQTEPGLRVDHLLTARLRLPRARYPEKKLADAFFRQVLERIKRLPGVDSAGATSILPLGGDGIDVWRAHLEEGKPEPPNGVEHRGPWSLVTPGYFRTMGIPLIKGRDFSPQDNREAVPVTIINEAMAEKMFPGRDPLGKRIRSWRDENMLREIVGVVGNVARYSIDDEVRSTIYVPFEQGNWTLQGLTIRTSSDPQTLASTIRSEVWSLDPDLPVTRIETMEERLAATMEGERFNMLLLGLFAIVALTLAAIGIYGLLSYSVTQRSHEIGIRMALGAERTDVLRGVLRQGLVLTLMGVGTGLGLALALTRVLSNLLFEVSAADPLTYFGVSALLVIVAVAASLVPALRATEVDPIVTLRYE
jgi:putative ABC transport system permease protein